MTQIDPSFFNEKGLEWFSADELLRFGGAQRVSYYGYSYTGKKQSVKDRPSFEDFFNARDDYGNLTRPVAPFEPIYMAAFVMDKFAIEDMKFNVGLRVDRFDANQMVLKDKFLLYGAKTAGEVSELVHPEGIGEDYVVYVNDINNPITGGIAGYRDDERWFNASGQEITDPTLIATPTGIAPYLVDITDAVNKTDIDQVAFKDYTPQLNIMPRISFSFNLTTEATFFAHYDILTKRPTSSNRFDMLDYFYLRENPGSFINNPDLKSEKTIDYELGFQQKLNAHSSMKISAFYRELRDLAQVRNIFMAYPSSYRTMGNFDFGTVKGMTIKYDFEKNQEHQIECFLYVAVC